MSPPKTKLLLVDDEQQVIDGLTRGLRGSYDIRAATSGAAALELLAREPDIALVMSDMRMPLMNGAAFLAKARALCPDTVRVLLTGQADMDDAVAAINEGSIFRFLRKPCSPDLMRATLTAAAEQHRLVTAERELLEQTLRGAVQALCDTLALASPNIFGASTRVKRAAMYVASQLGVKETWPLEVAAMVCQIGAITLPAGLYERRAHKAAMLPRDREMIDRIPVVTEQLLAPIPRLEPVREIIRHTFARSTALEKPMQLATRILAAALDFEELESLTSTSEALEKLQASPAAYGAEVIAALTTLYAKPEIKHLEVPVLGLREGMIIAVDVATKGGVLIVARGHEVTPSLMARLRNFVSSLETETIKVLA